MMTSKTRLLHCVIRPTQDIRTSLRSPARTLRPIDRTTTHTKTARPTHKAVWSHHIASSRIASRCSFIQFSACVAST